MRFWGVVKPALKKTYFYVIYLCTINFSSKKFCFIIRIIFLSNSIWSRLTLSDWAICFLETKAGFCSYRFADVFSFLTKNMNIPIIWIKNGFPLLAEVELHCTQCRVSLLQSFPSLFFISISAFNSIIFFVNIIFE